MKRGLVSVALVFLLAVILSSPSYAQTTGATVTGQITDPSGGVVPDVFVIFTNINTGIASTTRTNGSGIFTLPTLQPGIYRANVAKDGFKSIAKSDIELHVQDQISINFALQVGSVSESVTVEGGAPLIDATSAAVGTVVDRQFVENIPLNGRSFQSLITVAPGVISVPGATTGQPRASELTTC